MVRIPVALVVAFFIHCVPGQGGRMLVGSSRFPPMSGNRFESEMLRSHAVIVVALSGSEYCLSQWADTNALIGFEFSDERIGNVDYSYWNQFSGFQVMRNAFTTTGFSCGWAYTYPCAPVLLIKSL